MTRMLCSILALLLITSSLSGCSIFGDEETTSVSEIDKEAAGIEGLEELEEGDDPLEAEDESLAIADEDLDPLEDAFSDEEQSLESNLEDEFASATLPDEGDDFSDTDEDSIDQELAGSELDEFDEFDDDSFNEDEEIFAAQEGEEVEPAQPIVDIPGQENLQVGQNKITNLQYKAFANGGTVVIETSEPATFEKFVDPDLNQIVIQVNDVFLPQQFKRPYITKDFKQDIATINAYADETGAARFVIQMKRPVEPLVQQEGNSILVLTSEATPMQQASAGPAEESLDQLVAENEMEIPAEVDGMTISTSPQAGSKTGASNSRTKMTQPLTNKTQSNSLFGGNNSKSGLRLNEGNFVGETISLEFIDTDVRQIIEVIAEKSGINLIMDKEVSGSTSIRLRKVPWDQALLVLLRSQGLGYVKQGSVLRIAKQSTLSSEAQAVSAQIKNEKEAKLLSGGIKVKYIPVSYAEVADLAKKLATFTSKEGKIAHDDRTSSLVVTDYGEYIERIMELIKALDSPPMQVEIESKLVEARENFLREAGINWDFTGQDFSLGSQDARFGATNPGVPSQNPGAAGFDLSVGTFDIFGDLNAALSIFESEDKIKVLSRPRIITMNKVPAEIQQTTEIPILVTTVQPGGVAQTQPEFKPLTLALKVTPQITFKGDVILSVDLQREFAGVANIDGQRELNRRSAKTTVMVKNGKTAVIGGIYQLDDIETEAGIPLLKDIPLIGYLFKSIVLNKSKNELLLFLKPKILREVEGPLVSRSQKAEANYDPFEELSVDEGSDSVESNFKADEPLTDDDDDDLDFDDEDSFSL